MDTVIDVRLIMHCVDMDGSCST